MTHPVKPKTAFDPVSLDQLLEAFPSEFVDINPQEQGLAIALYRLLVLGEPVSQQRLADESKIPLADVNRLVANWLGVFQDDAENIVGFWGMGLAETPHKIVTEGHELYAWCAWDTLFLPALIGHTAQIDSRCAQSGESIQLTISPQCIESVKPDTTLLSFVIPDEQGIRTDIVTNFCHSVLYFASAELGELWLAEHPGTFLMSVEKAFEFAQMVNRRKFPAIFSN